MDRKTQWEQLADAIGFQFTNEIRPLVELPSLHKMAADALKKGDFQKVEKLYENPVLARMLISNFPGSAKGIYRGYEFALFPNTASGSKPAYYVNIILLFQKQFQMGMEIQNSTFLTRVKKTLGLGSYLKEFGNEHLDKMIAIQANRKDQVLNLLAHKSVQDSLLNLYNFSNSFEISDRDIRYTEPNAIIERDRALQVMDSMVEAAISFTSAT